MIYLLIANFGKNLLHILREKAGLVKIESPNR